MTANNDQPAPPGSEDELSAEIERTMAEAEAAVSALDDDQETAQMVDEEGSEDGIEIVDADVVEVIDSVDSVDFDAQLAAKDEQIAALKDKWLRAVADHDNYKKRVKRDIDDATSRVTQSLLVGFLPTVDNLERALEIAEPAAAQASDENAANVEQVVTGLKMVRDNFVASLKKHNIEAVPALGEPFDPSIHEALQQIDSPDHAPGVVIREFEKGFKLGTRLLRPARVIVAGAGSGSATES